MSDPLQAWTRAFSHNQAAFLQALFPKPTGGDTPTDGEKSKSPLQAQFDEIRQTWKESMAKWAALTSKGRDTVPKAETLRDLFSAERWTDAATGPFNAGLRQLLEGPRYAVLWDADRRLLELQQLSAERDRAVARYQSLVQKGWSDAVVRFSKSMPSRTAPSQTWRELAERWIATLNETLLDVYRSPEFVEAQRHMLRAIADHRLQERRICEAWCEVAQLPTRTELDEVQRTLTDVRRRVRLLERSCTSDSGRPDTAGAVPKPRRSPRRKRSPATV
jgi:hypothetical protein